jgi:hypothetical protein
MRLTLAFTLIGLLLVITVAESSSEASKVISASEVLANVQRGEPIEYDNYIIEGVLNLSNLEIHGNVHFNNTLFQDEVNFNSTKFNGPANFWYSIFNGAADFRHSKFNDSANFQVSKFNGYANFGYSKFNGPAYFMGARFNKTADFGIAKFSKAGDFKGTNFNNNAYFMGSDFGRAFFNGALFGADADFRGSNFSVYSNFENARILGYSYLVNAVFKGDANFMGVQFRNDADFEEAEFDGNAYFDNARFFGVALLEDTIFSGNLSLKKANYDKLYIRWHNIKSFDYDENSYLMLIENFKRIGFYDDANKCYFQYMMDYRNRQTFSGWAISTAWLLFGGYGVDMSWPFYSSLFIILAFGFIYRLKFHMFPPKGDGTLGCRMSAILNVLIFSFTVFLSGTKLFVDPPKYQVPPGRNEHLVGWLERVIIIERIFGSLLFFAILYVITKTIIR